MNLRRHRCTTDHTGNHIAWKVEAHAALLLLLGPPRGACGRQGQDGLERPALWQGRREHGGDGGARRGADGVGGEPEGGQRGVEAQRGEERGGVLVVQRVARQVQRSQDGVGAQRRAQQRQGGRGERGVSQGEAG